MASGYFSSSYRVDMQIFRSLWIRIWMAMLIVLVLVMPLFIETHIIYLLTVAGITIISAIGMNIITGFTGQISMAQAAFMGIGAYASAILGNTYGLPFWITYPAAGLIAALISIILAVPSLRLKGLYLIMSTMAFEVIMEYVFMQWKDLTLGASGMDAPYPQLGSFVFDRDLSLYYLTLALVVLALVLASNLMRTKSGRAFISIRDHDVAAKIIGINLTKYKIMAFAISSFYAGVAGALYGSVMHHFDPENFNMIVSIEYLTIVIIGGMGSITGTVFGSLFMVTLPEILRAILDLSESLRNFMSTHFFDVKILIFGFMIVIFLIGEPGGLYALWGRVKTYFRRYPYTY